MLALSKRKGFKALVAVAAAAIVFAGGAGTAQAVLAGHSSGGSVSTTAATESDAYVLPAAAQGAWLNVPGMVRSVSIGSGTTRQLIATYNAEAQCTGTGWCSVRIIAINSAGGVVEFYPQSGTDFAFDSDGDIWSAHSITRTLRVGAGTWRIQVQAARVAGSSTSSPALRLDEQYFGVETRI